MGKKLNKEETAEDWCFVCKDGGQLRICDYKECLKAYHPDCVNKDDSFLKSTTRWACGCHTCLHCKKRSCFSCYCCPKSVCRRCIDLSEFVHIKEKKVFCIYCLGIALLVEENKDFDSDDGTKVDFEDQETYEYMFMEYWAVINEKEGLTAENLRSAKKLYKMGKNYVSDLDVDEFDTSEEEDQQASDSDVMSYYSDEGRKPKRRKLTGISSPGGKKSKRSSKKEFCGWGSKVLLQFLKSIGKDPSEKLSQHQVTSIINRYSSENKLFHPQKKKQIICDEQLKCVLGKKIVGKHKIFELLETHFAENLDSSSDDDDYAYNSEEMNGYDPIRCIKRRSSDKLYSDNKDFEPCVNQNSLASLVAENIKLIYLKKSLVKVLLNQNESFESKVVGSFVRVKSDPNDLSQKNLYQLVQVTGIKNSSLGKIDTKIFLKVSSMPQEITISDLSDDDFNEEEFEDLRLRVERGQFKHLTVSELEQKARLLHEDQTNHWIERELKKLENLIDRANEKGWRREFYEHMERRKLLSSSNEQSRLLKEFPEVIPHDEEKEKNDACEEISPKSILGDSSEDPVENIKAKGTYSVKHSPLLKEFPKAIPQVEVLNKHKEFKESSPRSILVLSSDIPNGTLSGHNQHTEINNKKEASSIQAAEENQESPKPSTPAPMSVIDVSSDDEYENDDVEDKNDDAEDKNDEKDRSDDKLKNDTAETQKLDVPQSSRWFCLGANGETSGPHSVSFLKKWSDTCSFALKLKVWKTNQVKENAVLLGDVVKN